jgi:hypothetical protein
MPYKRPILKLKHMPGANVVKICQNSMVKMSLYVIKLGNYHGMAGFYHRIKFIILGHVGKLKY